jgi:hypothetical protein
MEPGKSRARLIWSALAIAVGVPLAFALASPLHAWRPPVYIAGALAGVVGLCLLLAQPLLVGGYLPGLSGYRGRLAHRWIGGGLVAAIVIHVGGLWIASPPDMIDALLFASPTPFSPWGVVAMWAIFASALLAVFRRRLAPRNWRVAHVSLAAVIIVGSVVHGLLIEGTMETMSKAALSALVVLAAVKVVADRLALRRRREARVGEASRPR